MPCCVAQSANQDGRIALSHEVMAARAVLAWWGPTWGAFRGYVLIVALVIGMMFRLFNVRLIPNVLVIQEVAPRGRGCLLFGLASAGQVPGSVESRCLAPVDACRGIDTTASGSRWMLSSGGCGILGPSPKLIQCHPS